MSNICGWSGPNNSTAVQTTQKQFSAVIESHSNFATLQNTNSVLMVQKSHAVAFHRSIHGTVAVIGHLNGPHRQHQNPLDGLISAYRRQGPTFLNACSGQFAIAILLASSPDIFLAVDRLSTIPLYIQSAPDSLCFSTVAPADALSNPADVFKSLYFSSVMVSQEQQLSPGHCLIWRDGQQHIQPYWQPDPKGDAPEGNYIQRSALFEQHLKRATTRYGGQLQVGLHYSGDTPSLYLARTLETSYLSYPLPIFITDYEGAEPAAFSLPQIGGGFRVHREVISPDQFISSVTQATKRLGLPLSYLPSLSTLFASESAAESGIARLLSSEGCKTLLQHSNRYLRKAEGGFFDRWSRWFQTSQADREEAFLHATCESGQWFNTLGYSNIFSKSFLKECSPLAPSQWVEHAYAQENGLTTLGKLQSLNIQFRLSHCQLSNMHLVSQASGMMLHFPYLSTKLINFSLGLPDSWKIDNRYQSSFIHQFFNEQLGQANLYPVSAPISQWYQTHKGFKSWVDAHIAHLRSTGMFTPVFLDSILSAHHGIPANTYDKVVWLLLSFSIWMTVTKKQAGRESIPKNHFSSHT